MASADFEALINRARSFVRDTSGSYIDEDDLGNWINEAYRDIASRLEILQHEVTGVIWVGFSGELDFPPDAANNPDIIDVLSLRFENDDVEFVAGNIFNSWKDSTQSPPATLGHIFEAKIEVWPWPEAGVRYFLRYAFIPDELVQPNDVHVLPVQLERKLIEYAVAQAKYKDDDPATGDRWFARYEQGLPEVSRGRKTLQPGPMSFSPMPSYFELDAQSHRSSRA